MQDFGITARMWTDAKRQPLYETNGLGQNITRRTLEYAKPLRCFHTPSAETFF